MLEAKACNSDLQTLGTCRKEAPHAAPIARNLHKSRPYPVRPHRQAASDQVSGALVQGLGCRAGEEAWQAVARVMGLAVHKVSSPQPFGFNFIDLPLPRKFDKNDDMDKGDTKTTC